MNHIINKHTLKSILSTKKDFILEKQTLRKIV